MAQKQKAPRQAKDPYAQRSKELTSAVQRLRGWVGSDPTRLPELGDALVALTGHRLSGHEYAAAGPDAQDSVKQAAQLLTAPGAVGAYTQSADAARYVTAVVQLAAVQAGLGLAEPAGRTVASLDDLHEQFLALRLELPLAPEVVVRALSCTARGALAGDDVVTAAATADEALRRLVAAGLPDDPDATAVTLEVEQLVADTRWAADRPADALATLHRARDRWSAVVDGRLDAPAGLSPALVARLVAPAPALHRDLADRLVATGEVDLGLVTRRTLVDLLRRVGSRGGPAAPRLLATALADLASDLLAVGRHEEADSASAEGLAVPGVAAEPGWPVVVRARVLVGSGHPADAVALLGARPVPAEQPALAGLVQQTLADAHRAAGDSSAAEQAEQAVASVVQQLGLAGPDRLADRVRGVVSRGRQAVTWEPLGPTVWDRLAPAAAAAAPAPAPAGASEAQDTGWLEAERAEAHRLEEERSAQARADAVRREEEERAEARRAAEQAEQERRRQVAEQQAEEARQAAAAEAERLETKRRREERLEAYRVEAERRAAEEAAAEAALRGEPAPAATTVPAPAEPAAPATDPRPAPEAEVRPAPEPEPVPDAEPGPLPAVPAEPVPAEPAPRTLPEPVADPVVDPLDLARQAWQQARAAGDRRTTRAAAERLVEVLRPRAEAEPAAHIALLQQVLSELAGLRMRGGDLRGARAASREARELGRGLGR
ncbi:hypothetical protein ACFFOM_03035 [Microlunatus capsulatus]|uniref:TolA protein n=1 Tax=Microlunatus capsulatus TaxID=99117 RepID=A0ABS4Z2M5_9ACTN|nr:hypothetical protein [Microlunatus capsulatus]MBP2415299.1 hypothetical protein [Microlunatus capsulatus]